MTKAVKAGGLVYMTGERDAQNCLKIIMFKRKLIFRWIKY